MGGIRHLKLCGLAALGLALGLGTAQAQDKTFELKLSHWVPPSHPLQKAIQDWADDIQKQSNGTITYKIYPAQQLGKAFDHYDMAKDGIADFVYVNPGYQPGRFPIISAGELPFLVGQARADAANGISVRSRPTPAAPAASPRLVSAAEATLTSSFISIWSEVCGFDLSAAGWKVESG